MSNRWIKTGTVIGALVIAFGAGWWLRQQDRLAQAEFVEINVEPVVLEADRYSRVFSIAPAESHLVYLTIDVGATTRDAHYTLQTHMTDGQETLKVTPGEDMNLHHLIDRRASGGGVIRVVVSKDTGPLFDVVLNQGP